MVIPTSIRRRFTLLFLALASLSLVAAREEPGRRLPRLIFAARSGHPGSIPAGIGPIRRFVIGTGRLVVRERDGRTHPFLAPNDTSFVDVSDPSVSWDARLVAFAAVAAPPAPRHWRIWLANADGSDVHPLTHDPIDGSPVDDIDPAWLPDGRVVFSSTRFPQTVGEAHPIPATNLFAVHADGTELVRITSERNGAEEPSVDPRNGRIVYARFWFNRWRPPAVPADTLVLDPAHAIPTDIKPLWHAISIRPDGDGMKLAGGWPRIRAEIMAYQPVILRDGTLVGVETERPDVAALARLDNTTGPLPVELKLVAFPGGFARPVTIREDACSPCALPDDGIVFSGRTTADDFALWFVPRPGDAPLLIADTPGMDDLDAAVFEKRKAPPVDPGDLPPPRRDRPVVDRAPLEDLEWTFRFDCLNVFANGAVDSPFPDALPLTKDARIRFFAALDRPRDAGGDTITLVREAPLAGDGSVHEHDMPADTPMFEELIDTNGVVIRGMSGVAHVPGFNFGRFGSGTKCVGCHLGHSAMEVPKNYEAATWTNIAPSAAVTTSETGYGAGNDRALVDRRVKGPNELVSWRTNASERAWIRLGWAFPVEVREVILYAPWDDRRTGTDSRIHRTDIEFRRAGRLVGRSSLERNPAPVGTHIAMTPTVIDSLVIDLEGIAGSGGRRPGGTLAEVEVIGRLIES